MDAHKINSLEYSGGSGGLRYIEAGFLYVFKDRAELFRVYTYIFLSITYNYSYGSIILKVFAS